MSANHTMHSARGYTQFQYEHYPQKKEKDLFDDSGQSQIATSSYASQIRNNKSSGQRRHRIHSFKDRSQTVDSPLQFSPTRFHPPNKSNDPSFYPNFFSLHRSGSSSSRENLKDMFRKSSSTNYSSQGIHYQGTQTSGFYAKNSKLSVPYRSESQLDSCSDRSVCSSFENLSGPYSFLSPVSPKNSLREAGFAPYQFKSQYPPGHSSSMSSAAMAQQKRSLNQMMFRLAVDDQDMSMSSSKRDYNSTEHRSGWSPQISV